MLHETLYGTDVFIFKPKISSPNLISITVSDNPDICSLDQTVEKSMYLHIGKGGTEIFCGLSNISIYLGTRQLLVQTSHGILDLAITAKQDIIWNGVDSKGNMYFISLIENDDEKFISITPQADGQDLLFMTLSDRPELCH
jgi:hypothetical protein